MAAVFRVVDQQGHPLESTAFNVSCFGSDEKVESFEGGYNLLTYTLSRGSSSQPCKINVEQEGFKVFVDPFSAQYLNGVTIDYVSSMQGSGFTFTNPNASGGCGCGSSFSA